MKRCAQVLLDCSTVNERRESNAIVEAVLSVQLEANLMSDSLSLVLAFLQGSADSLLAHVPSFSRVLIITSPLGCWEFYCERPFHGFK